MLNGRALLARAYEFPQYRVIRDRLIGLYPVKILHEIEYPLSLRVLRAGLVYRRQQRFRVCLEHVGLVDRARIEHHVRG